MDTRTCPACSTRPACCACTECAYLTCSCTAATTHLPHLLLHALCLLLHIHVGTTHDCFASCTYAGTVCSRRNRLRMRPLPMPDNKSTWSTYATYTYQIDETFVTLQHMQHLDKHLQHTSKNRSNILNRCLQQMCIATKIYARFR